MMREIKFRGLRTDGNGWVYGFYALWQNEHMIFPETSIGRPRKVIPETVGQFTGLKDKNGTEIYEGDVMINPNPRCGKSRFLVVWTVGGYDARYFEQGNYTLCLYPVLGEFDGCEVIGNTHTTHDKGKEETR